MTNREKALQAADDAKEQVENGGISLDTKELFLYAIVYVLADISHQLEDIEQVLESLPPQSPA